MTSNSNFEIDPNEAKKLRNKTKIAFSCSSESVEKHSKEYSELKNMLNMILLESIDIDQFYPLFERITSLIKILREDKKNSHFDYFFKNIFSDNKIYSVRYFRFNCLDLRKYIAELDAFIIDSRKKKFKLIGSNN